MTEHTKMDFRAWQAAVVAGVELGGAQCAVSSIPTKQWKQWYVGAQPLEADIERAGAYLYNAATMSQRRRDKMKHNRFGS